MGYRTNWKLLVRIVLTTNDDPAVAPPPGEHTQAGSEPRGLVKLLTLCASSLLWQTRESRCLTLPLSPHQAHFWPRVLLGLPWLWQLFLSAPPSCFGITPLDVIVTVSPFSCSTSPFALFEMLLFARHTAGSSRTVMLVIAGTLHDASFATAHIV